MRESEAAEYNKCVRNENKEVCYICNLGACVRAYVCVQYVSLKDFYFQTFFSTKKNVIRKVIIIFIFIIFVCVL